MKVYKFKFDYKKAIKLDYVNEKDEIAPRFFNHQPLKPAWKTTQLKWYNDKKKDKITDCVRFIPDLVSERAMEALAKLVGNQAEFLPMQLEDKTFYIVNALNKVHVNDVLDFRLSIPYFNKEGNIYDFQRKNFKPGKIIGHHIFVLTGIDHFYCFVSEEFKKVIDDNNFTGFEFTLIWDEDIDYEALDAEKERLKNRESYYSMYPIGNSFSWDMDRGRKLMKKELKFSIFTADKQAKQVSVAIDKYLEDHIIPPIFNTLEDYSTHLSYCFGDALAFHEWGWCRLGEDKRIALVDKDQNGSFFIMDYILSILKGENPYGNDLMEIFELTTKVQPGEKKYMPIR